MSPERSADEQAWRGGASWVLTAPTFWALLQRRAELTPDATMFLAEPDVRVSFAEFRERAERVAAALAAAGIGPGSRVAWQLPTRVSTLLVMAALRRLGAVQVPIIAIYREREVMTAVTATGAEVILVPGTWKGFDYVAMAEGVAASVAADSGGPPARVQVIGTDAPELDDTSGLPPVPDDPDEIAWIYFTSGSTGGPKGVRHSDGTLLNPSLEFVGISHLGERPDEVGTIAFPAAHVGGAIYTVAVMGGGFAAVLLEAFVPEEAAATFRKYSVTTTGGAPPFYSAFVALARAHGGEHPVPTLRTMKGGGAPCPPSLFWAVRKELSVTLAHDYGMTEVPMLAAASPLDPDEVLAETDGRVLTCNRLRILAPDGSPCPTGEIGEVQITGAGVCHGYTDPETSAAAFTADGYFRTGDLGRLRESGHIEVVGRLKDVIIRKGENVAPQEIEELLARHPGIAEVAVIGLPDEERGEMVCAVVVPAPDGPAPDLPALAAYLTEAGLMRQKLPERLELVDVLPRTGLSKVAKAELRVRFSAPAPG